MSTKQRMKSIVKKQLAKRGLYITRVFPATIEGNYVVFQRLKNQGFTPTSILDVGASDGKWSREIMEVFPRANYLLIEPREHLKPVLEAFAAAHKNIRIHSSLVGDIEKTVEFYQQGDQSTVFVSEEANQSSKKTLLTMTTIDNLVKQLQFPWPQLVKMDIQGAEILALKGSSETMNQAQFITLEVSFYTNYADWPLIDEVIQFMSEKKFYPYDIYEFVRDEVNRLAWCMILFKSHT